MQCSTYMQGQVHYSTTEGNVNPGDWIFAANQVTENGQVVEEIGFPLLGLLTDTDAWTLVEKRAALLGKAADMGWFAKR